MKTVIFAGALLLLIASVRSGYRRSRPTAGIMKNDKDTMANSDTITNSENDEKESDPKEDPDDEDDGGGYITVRNKGQFFVKFSIDYILKNIPHGDKSGSFYKNKEKTLKIPKGAKEIKLKIEQDFKVRQTTIFEKDFGNDPPKIAFEISGKTDTPKCSLYEG